MRRTYLTFLLCAIVALPVSAQTYTQDPTQLRSEAQQAYNRKDWQAATELFGRLSGMSGARPGDVYNAACSAALAGRIDEAFDFLNRSLDAGFDQYEHVLKYDTDLVSLRADKRWQPVAQRLIAAIDAHDQLMAALPQPFSLFGDLQKVGYFGPYLEMESLPKKHADAPEMWRGILWEAIAWTRAVMGDPMGALRAADARSTPRSAPVAAEFDSYRPEPALPLIIGEARRTRVTLINEGHHIPQHRVLTLELLQALWQDGYRYFAVEAVYDASVLNERGYPVVKTGGYTMDPAFGDLLRTAKRIGFEVIAYDTFSPGCVATATDPGRCFTERDSLAARRLYDATFAQDRAAKVLVHAGYSHVLEKSSSVKALAYWLKEWTGADPLTVDQTQMREYSEPRFEDPQYVRAVHNGWVTQPIVLRRPDGTIHRSASGGFSGVDLQVYTPRTQIAWSRPDWMFERAGRKVIPLNANHATDGRVLQSLVPRTGGPFLVQAFVAGEPDDAVPMDHVVSDGGNVTLALRAGSYVLKVLDREKVIATAPFVVR